MAPLWTRLSAAQWNFWTSRWAIGLIITFGLFATITAIVLFHRQRCWYHCLGLGCGLLIVMSGCWLLSNRLSFAAMFAPASSDNGDLVTTTAVPVSRYQIVKDRQGHAVVGPVRDSSDFENVKLIRLTLKDGQVINFKPNNNTNLVKVDHSRFDMVGDKSAGSRQHLELAMLNKVPNSHYQAYNGSKITNVLLVESIDDGK